MKEDNILVGKISGVFGVKGWLKVFSYTEPTQNILGYKNWWLQKGSQELEIKVNRGQLHGKGLVIHVDGIEDRDEAIKLVGYSVYITHDQLPKVEENEYYWVDLIGLDVETLEGIQLGKVESLMETGANDIFVVKGERERALPFIQGQTIKSIDLEANKMIVDWDPDF